MIDNLKQLQDAVRSGKIDFKDEAEVYTRISPCGKLILFKYLETAVFANRWNFLEQISRGLILERATGRVVAYPFDKFWNYGENGRYPPITSRLLYAAEKMDGSLGIIYWYNNRWNVATNGSFASDQAVWADNWLNSVKGLRFRKYAGKGWTYMVEIIYGDNQIVVDYKDYEGLVLLGMRDIHTLVEWPYYPEIVAHAELFGWRTPEIWLPSSIDEVLAKTKSLPFQEEGYVLVFEEKQQPLRFKVKGQEYLRVHKLVTGITPRRIYELIKEHGDIDKYLMSIPEEFWPEIKEEASKINLRIKNRVDEVFAIFANRPTDGNRRNYANWVVKTAPHVARYLFKLYDNYTREQLTEMVTNNYEKDFLE